jgi:hypothetical protein
LVGALARRRKSDTWQASADDSTVLLVLAGDNDGPGVGGGGKAWAPPRMNA